MRPSTGTSGSSPRMRGAQTKHSSAPCLMRIIPADAGSTAQDGWRSQIRRDHPRGCGEHAALSSVISPASGSSPRMRGALHRPSPDGAHDRIIPADAGSTAYRWRRLWAVQDHPRGCGEHTVTTFCKVPVAGSSPRMRGARCCRLDRRPGLRIIPADAGSTERTLLKTPALRDHPRGCGEHYLGRPRDLRPGGSSPRMRGARRQ